MSSEYSTRGVHRVLAKLESALADGNYYEAHQMYKTLCFRYTGQKRYDECLDLLYKGALTLLDNDHYSSGAELTLSVIDTLEKKGDIEDYDIWINKLGVLIKKISPNIVERESIITRSVKWSGEIAKNSLGHPNMHKVIAQIFWSEGNSELARHHYLLSRDGHSCGQMLIELSQTKGYANETDLFIAQVVLQQLCLKETKTALQTFETYTKYHPKIACTEPPFVMPLLNFIFFLLKTIDAGRQTVFKSLCDRYKSSIDRDPAYEKYLQKIGVIFFGVTPARNPMMNTIFGDIFTRLLQGIDDGESEDEQESHPQTRRNRQTNATAELD